MRYSEMFLPTVREVPSDAEVISHQLMIRAGMIRKLTTGIYSVLPLGYRTVKKVEQIIREEMDGAGAQEVYLPAVQPPSSGRNRAAGSFTARSCCVSRTATTGSAASAPPTRKSSRISFATRSRPTASCPATCTRSRRNSVTRSARDSASCAAGSST